MGRCREPTSAVAETSVGKGRSKATLEDGCGKWQDKSRGIVHAESKAEWRAKEQRS